MINKKLISTTTDYQVPLDFYESDSDSVLLFLPALGVKARFYQSLAQEFQQRGQSIILFEQRGHGESDLRASRHNDWSYKNYLQEDLLSVVEWVQSRHPTKRLILAGHSMGGHMSLCFAAMHPSLIQQVILLGCGTPWKGVYSGKTRFQLGVLNVLTWLSIKSLRYYPGDKLGFAGREAAGFIRDWRNLLNQNRYHSDSMSEDFEKLISLYEGNVLSISFDADDYAPWKSVQAVTQKLISAELNHKLIKSKQQGFLVDHFNWAKQPGGTVNEILHWIAKYRRSG